MKVLEEMKKEINDLQKELKELKEEVRLLKGSNEYIGEKDNRNKIGEELIKREIFSGEYIHRSIYGNNEIFEMWGAFFEEQKYLNLYKKMDILSLALEEFMDNYSSQNLNDDMLKKVSLVSLRFQDADVEGEKTKGKRVNYSEETNKRLDKFIKENRYWKAYKKGVIFAVAMYDFMNKYKN